MIMCECRICINLIIFFHWRYRILVFRDQGLLSPKRQVEITRWFGEPDPANYGPKNPNQYVARISNDPTEGEFGVGSAGFHLDGTYRDKPYAFSLYHGINVTAKGETGQLV